MSLGGSFLLRTEGNCRCVGFRLPGEVWFEAVVSRRVLKDDMVDSINLSNKGLDRVHRQSLGPAVLKSHPQESLGCTNHNF